MYKKKQTQNPKCRVKIMWDLRNIMQAVTQNC